MKKIVLSVVFALAALAAPHAQGRTRPAATEKVESVEEKDLPKPVANAIHAHPKAIFVSARKVTNGTDVRYEITVRGSRKTHMVAKADGTVLSFQ